MSMFVALNPLLWSDTRVDESVIRRFDSCVNNLVVESESSLLSCRPAKMRMSVVETRCSD